MTRCITVLCLAPLLAGCTALQLQRSTVRQAESLSDIYQQQVLDNLAKFVQNPEALPDFAVPSAGTSQVTDDFAQGGSSLGFMRSGFDLATLGLPQGQRSVNLSWSLDPIRDPHKLTLMRCAYQKSVMACSIGPACKVCVDCDKTLDAFFGIKRDGTDTEASLAKRQRIEPRCCWFQTGSKKDVPKRCDCLFVGHYCGTYVWVLPEGRSHLTELTLAILDFAFRETEAAAAPTKDVTAYFNKEGKLVAKQEDAAIVVSTTLDLTTPLDNGNIEQLLIGAKEAGKAAPRIRPRTLDDRLRPNLLDFRQELNLVTPRLRR